jgi:HPt (histidine-containing phosphotransfer) domain-containing protein
LRQLFAKNKANLRRHPPNFLLTFSMLADRIFSAESRGARAGRLRNIAMPLHLDRIDWMPSPPLVPDDGPIDIAHLQRMTLGDASLEREVLVMFSTQALGLVCALANSPANAGTLVHTLKGSARAIGAFAVADAASSLELLVRSGGDPRKVLVELNDAVAQARAAIDEILQRS